MTGILTEQKFISDCRYRVIESSSLFPYFLEKCLAIPTSTFFIYYMKNDSAMTDTHNTEPDLPIGPPNRQAQETHYVSYPRKNVYQVKTNIVVEP